MHRNDGGLRRGEPYKSAAAVPSDLALSEVLKSQCPSTLTIEDTIKSAFQNLCHRVRAFATDSSGPMKRDEKPKSDAATRAYVYPPPHMTGVLLLTQERRCNKTEQKSNGSATEEREAAREQTQPHFVRVLWQVWGVEFVCV